MFTRTPRRIAALLALAPLACAAQQSTDWKALERGMSTLLNDGWRIESMTYNQVMEREFGSAKTGQGEIKGYVLASVPKGLEYSFLLSKAGKWVVCIVIDPAVDDAKSRCRALN